MQLSSCDILSKTLIGIQFTLDPKAFPTIVISTTLRRLLIVIDGRQSIDDLLSKGLSGVDMSSFEQLAYQGLVVQRSASTVTVQPAVSHAAKPMMSFTVDDYIAPIISSKKRKSFSATRFEMLDVLLSLTLKDIKAKPWVEDFEKAQTMEGLNFASKRFQQSPLGQKNLNTASLLNRILDDI